jgi:hypothetical protein
MAMTTLAALRAGLQRPVTFTKNSVVNSANVPAGSQTLWANIGYSTHGVMSSGAFNSTLNGAVLTSPTVGELNLPDPGGLEAYIAKAVMFNSQHTGGIFMLADRIWQNGGMSVTALTPQLITTPSWPARDDNDSSNGEGVFLALEISVGPTATNTPVITVEYTNSDGVAGRTATTTMATAPRSTFGAWMFGLQAGDKGIRSIQSLTLSASWVSGTINLAAYRPLALFAQCPMTLSQAQIFDAVSLCMPRIKPGVVPFFYTFTANSGSGHAGPASADLFMSHG